ncbi:MAG: hypothetical protein M1608_11175 [Candidatus Omnitrophica bacterium]|nr:hypothetical protein [Candidatus Omnitrophota bacterium]
MGMLYGRLFQQQNGGMANGIWDLGFGIWDLGIESRVERPWQDWAMAALIFFNEK